jgi:polyisoprenoid-binding protein YceI
MRMASQWLAAVVIALTVGSVQASDWQVETANSDIRFVARWDGIAFEGAFEKWDARIMFSPDVPPTGRFEVKLDTASINSRSKDRDRGMLGKEWFAAKLFPKATFVAERFATDGADAFLAMGQLSVKGVNREVSAPFGWRERAGGVELVGEIKLDRRDFDIGDGQWREDAIVGFEVIVKYRLKLKSVN